MDTNEWRNLLFSSPREKRGKRSNEHSTSHTVHGSAVGMSNTASVESCDTYGDTPSHLLGIRTAAGSWEKIQGCRKNQTADGLGTVLASLADQPLAMKRRL